MSTFEVIRGPEGCCLLLDDVCIAGPKPWGGGRVLHSWDTDEKYVVVSGGSRWYDLFGTPERAAQTLSAMQKCELGIIGNCDECDVHDACRVRDGDYDALLEWLNYEVDV